MLLFATKLDLTPLIADLTPLIARTSHVGLVQQTVQIVARFAITI